MIGDIKVRDQIQVKDHKVFNQLDLLLKLQNFQRIETLEILFNCHTYNHQVLSMKFPLNQLCSNKLN